MIALDTNILVYAFEPGIKGRRALELLGSQPIISVQVLNEYASSVRRKYGRSWDEIASDLEAVRAAAARIDPITEDANRTALRIVSRYRLGFYDSVLISVALAAGVQTLYSEDMQHGLLVDGGLRIVDPFRSTA